MLLNSAPVATTPVTMTGNTITIDATDPDADRLTYTVTQPAGGAVVQDPTTPNKFTYTGAGDETFAVTVSDADSGFHFHGLLGLFAPDHGHTTTVVVNVPTQTTAPDATDISFDLPDGYQGSGNSFVGGNNAAVRYGTDNSGNHVLAIRGADGDIKVVELGGAPAAGQNPLFTNTSVIQNIVRDDGSYAMVIIPTTPSQAPQARGFASLAAFTTSDAASDSYAVDLDGVPVGYALAGNDGIVYQTVSPVELPNGVVTSCSACHVTVVDTNRVSEIDYVPSTVDIDGTIMPGFTTIGGTKFVTQTVDPHGNLYLVATTSEQTSQVWIIDPADVDPTAANDGATVLTLSGYASPVQPVAFGPDGKGYLGTQTPATYTGQVEIIDPATKSVIDIVPVEGVPVLATFANGNVYQQVIALNAEEGTVTSIMYILPEAGGTPQQISYPGNSTMYGWPVAADDGTVYVGMVGMSPAGNDMQTGVIRPGSTTPTVVDLGLGYAVSNYQMGVVTGSTVTYQVVTSVDPTDNTGQTKVFRLSDADPDQSSHPLQPVATIDEPSTMAAAVVSSDGTLYFATTSGDQVTLWSLAAGSDTPLGSAFDGNGAPSAFEVTPDGHVYMTTVSADGSQNWIYTIG